MTDFPLAQVDFIALLGLAKSWQVAPPKEFFVDRSKIFIVTQITVPFAQTGGNIAQKIPGSIQQIGVEEAG